MIIKRDRYLKQLIDSKHNGLIKIITGIRRCGKSFLLNKIFKSYLIESGVEGNHIIQIALDERRHNNLLNPDNLDEFVRSKIIDSKMYYILLDEIQLVNDFESVLNGLLHMDNVDIYVTGSNSKFLSSDIVTEFRGRGTQIKVNPLSFKEFYSIGGKDKYASFDSYLLYGGMPALVEFKSNEGKAKYLKELFELTYKKDILDRYCLYKSDVLDNMLNILASSVGSLTNPNKLYNTFVSNGYKEISKNSISLYLTYFEDSFLINKVDRYDIKGKKYISTPFKYYFADIGLRNARLNFRQIEENHVMENIIYNELISRGYNVDVGIVPINESNKKKQLEVDFVCNLGNKRLYIQSALYLDTREKTLQEERPYMNINDSFKKIIIVKGYNTPWYTEEGILVIGIINFLLEEESIEY